MQAPGPDTFLLTLGVLGKVVILAMIVERALALVFDLTIVDRWLAAASGMGSPTQQRDRKRQERGGKAPVPGESVLSPVPISTGAGGLIKAGIAFLLSLAIVRKLDFDVLVGVFPEQMASSTSAGIALTAAVVAGGSAGAMSLFQGVLGMSKDARDARTAEAEARAAIARSQQEAAEAETAVARARLNAAVLDPAPVATPRR